MGPFPDFQVMEYILLIGDQFSKMIVPWERVPNVILLLHDSPSQGHFGVEKHTKVLVKGFIGSA